MRWRVCVVGFVAAAVALVAIDARATYGARISVDEPQYLLTAISLGEDGDLDISDELREERYREWHEAALLSQTVELDAAGTRVSPHDPLLPLLLAVPVRLGGWVGARLAMAAMAGIAAALTQYLAERRFNVSPAAALVGVVGFFASPPLVSFGNQMYPAMPATIAVLGCVAVVLGGASRRWWVGVMCIVALPWLAIKYGALAAVLAIGLLWKLRDNRAIAVRALLALAINGAIYLAFHRYAYGGWTVYATGDHFVDGEWQVVGQNVNVLGRTRRLIGLLVDRTFGIAAWAPAYLAGPAALAWLARTKREGWQLLLWLVLAGWAMATWLALTMHGWWWPGRQVVPVLPLIAIATAAAVDGHRRRVIALAAASLVASVGWVWVAIESSTGRRTLIVDFYETSYPFYRAWRRLLPDHQQYELGNPWLTGAWAVVIIGSCVAVWFGSRQVDQAHAEEVSAAVTQR